MNQSLLLHVVERIEGLIGKLPSAIQNPILSELTPLKELFLQQRLPRIVIAGGEKADSLGIPFAAGVHVWQDANFPGGGTMSIFDARGTDARQIEEELKRVPADIILFLDESSRGPRKIDIELLQRIAQWNPNVKTIGITEREERLREAIGDRLAAVATSPKELMPILAREVPDQARIEIIRISRDKNAQHEVSQVLIKSTAAICTAIGAQPIPLADMPVLTTLQLVMVSGIMYLSGRERTLRAATEFVGALGANVGAGIALREGARAILKFLPGWGNVVSGMVAGAGTFAIGRAAEAFFIEGVSIKDARRTYRKSRKAAETPKLPAPAEPKRRKTAKRKRGANNL
ncbi:MAG: uncharacterized protein QOG48_2404 [Verrucomicrobiota bacterium]